MKHGSTMESPLNSSEPLHINDKNNLFSLNNQPRMLKLKNTIYKITHLHTLTQKTIYTK